MIIIRTRQPNPELENKILTILRQEHIEAEQFSIRSPGQLVFPGLMVNETTREVLCEDRAVSLTRLEFDLLLLMLASHEGQAFSKEALFCAIWGQDCADTLKVVANTVSNLRKKLADCGGLIRTVCGGYVFVSRKEEAQA